MKQLLTILLLSVLPMIVFAQQPDSLKNQFTINTLRLETRADFDYNQSLDTNAYDCGFSGKYLNFILAGNLTNRFSYAYRQRILPVGKLNTFFDNTDYLSLTCHFKHGIDLTFGKQVVYIGGFEYDKAPIDVYYGSVFWNNMICYEIGLTATFTDKAKRNSLLLQFCNSPYATKPSDGLFAYNMAWYGNYKHFNTIYSINLFERQKGRYVLYAALGNQLVFDRWSLYLDYVNRASSTKKCFQDFSLIGRIDVNINSSITLFLKGGYDQNKAETVTEETPIKDIFVLPGTKYSFGGLGIVLSPKSYRDIRLHAFVAVGDNAGQTMLRCNAGLTWRINFTNFFKKS